MNYVLDTNVISDLTKNHPTVSKNVSLHRGDTIYLCQPAEYEIRRGLIWKNAPRKLHLLEQLKQRWEWIETIDSDWQRAAQLWADSHKIGRQLDDMDLLVAAIAIRLSAIVVTNDNDFDVLPAQCENWRDI